MHPIVIKSCILFYIGYSLISWESIKLLSDLEPDDVVAITLVTGAGDITDIFKIQLLQ